MAIFLAKETKALLIGESMDEDSLLVLDDIFNSRESVDEIGIIRSVHFGPTGVMVGVEVHFVDNYSLEEIEKEILDIEKSIKEKIPMVKHVFIEVKESVE